ncbi:uncharacterized protein LOC130640656 [Hydractinia symbiolongicarpus]|uniref:uncharacterized protein LOC130640656 n=1 Tax=Hydractinia symbiolongicarpus TaxID=13093 RepID=UPI00254F986E|nr:uncharacterized protein LOC130640656 [Hydractinia symbiolongicarpus]
MFKFFLLGLAAIQITFVGTALYTPDEEIPDGSITKYFKGKTEISCLLQCERDEQCDRVIFKLQNKQMRNGECWFVETNTGSIQKLKKDKSIKSYKKIMPEYPAQPVCHFGDLVITNTSIEYKCQCKREWTLLKRNVCFGTHPNEFGTFEIQNNAVMTDIKLVYVGRGGVTCIANTPLTKWGCDHNQQFVIGNIGVIITDNQNTILYPSMEYHIWSGFFSVPGYNANSPYLIFNAKNHTVKKGEELRLHYAETLFGYHENNNGTSCADIYAKLCDA